MQCLRCKRRISFLRSLRDQQFCSEDCRKRARASSARALRDEPDLAEDFEERWLDHAQPIQKVATKTSSSNSTISVVGISVLALFALTYMDQAGPRGAETRNKGEAPGLTENISRMLARIPSPKSSVNLTENFSAGVGNWKDTAGDPAWASPDWSWRNGSIRPGRLRIWKDSMELRDYRFEFEGKIERKSMAWAFRASDGGNYYASKLTLDENLKSTSAEIVRFAVVGGKESRRVSLPIPVQVAKDTFYRVAIKVKGDKFVTLLDGQVIDSWQDSRLRAGGVGFFGERGEIASIRSVNLTDPERFLEKIQSYLQFGFILPPGL